MSTTKESSLATNTSATETGTGVSSGLDQNTTTKTTVSATSSDTANVPSKSATKTTKKVTSATTKPVAKPAIVYLVDMQLIQIDDAIDKYEIARFTTALQGVVNRNLKRGNDVLYVEDTTTGDTDRFWLDYMMESGRMLEGYTIVNVAYLSQLVDIFETTIKQCGIILWDKAVPATSNVALTACGIYNYLPVMYDTGKNSMHSYLVNKGVAVKESLQGKFTGKGTIPGTKITSTGSTKNDAYLWALETYMPLCSKDKFAYVLDAAGTIKGNSVYERNKNFRNTQAFQIYNHDYFVQNKMFCFDLSINASEAPCDDPKQRIGTDYNTLKSIFSTMYTRNKGEFTRLVGFPPWWIKYTVYNNNGSMGEVAMEWALSKMASTYNCAVEADAASPASMANGSVYSKYPLSKKTYKNNTPAKVTYQKNVQYFTVYMGDYDSSSWMKHHVPNFWNDSARGTLPLSWAFNPNLADRVPMAYEYVMENLSKNDFMLAGDSGAGYIFPCGLLGESGANRENRPSAADKWVDYCEDYMDRFSLKSVGFVINGGAGYSDETFAMYNKIAPNGSFLHHFSEQLVTYNGVPYMNMDTDLLIYEEDVCEKAYRAMINGSFGSKQYPFTAYRIVCQSPTNVKQFVDNFIKYAKLQDDSVEYKYVDMYTMLNLVKQSGLANEIG